MRVTSCWVNTVAKPALVEDRKLEKLDQEDVCRRA